MTDDAADDLELEHHAIDRALDDCDWDRARALVDALAAKLGDDHEQIRYDRAVLAWELEGPRTALDHLDALLRDYPDHADAHYIRAIACEELDDREGMILHYAKVLELDADAFAELYGPEVELDKDELSLDEILDTIEAEARDVLADVPERFKTALAHVPIILEAAPHEGLVNEGFDPRALGLFEGPAHGRFDAGEAAFAPTRIVLFYANLLSDFPEPEALSDQIEITLLHEIGHYFGLDEDEVERLGLA